MKTRKPLDLSFIEESFKGPFLEWLDYKKELKDYYKTQSGIEKAYKNLKKMSNNNPETAQQIVDQAISKEWLGLYPLKNYGTPINQTQSSDKIGRASCRERVSSPV